MLNGKQQRTLVKLLVWTYFGLLTSQQQQPWHMVSIAPTPLSSRFMISEEGPSIFLFWRCRRACLRSNLLTATHTWVVKTSMSFWSISYSLTSRRKAALISAPTVWQFSVSVRQPRKLKSSCLRHLRLRSIFPSLLLTHLVLGIST